MQRSKLEPVYGWAMNFGNGYQKQKNIISTSSSKIQNDNPTNCEIFYTDGRFMNKPPYYQLGPQESINCPFYNYTLPDTYPIVPTPQINPKAYWYLPYSTFDWRNYNSDSIMKIPKPNN